MKKPIRTFIWKMYSKADANLFETFQDLCIKQGKHVNDVLKEFAINYNEENKTSIKLVTEMEMHEALKEKGFLSTRQTLIKKRLAGDLKDKNGNDLSFSDGRNVRYNYYGTLKYFEK